MEHGGTIFGLVKGQLVEMNAGPYISEAVLQQYLEDHVKLLAGEQIDPISPRRWLLIAREMSVPDILDGKERWSLDHLFVDQDGIPTLVEVKRSTNTEIRRNIVGQLLDYAANGSQYWSIGKIREAFAATCLRKSVQEEDALSAFLGREDIDPAEVSPLVESFWSQVQQNMEQGRIRLLFVADNIPTELRRVIEFLNKQMSPAHVMGIEIRQYISDEVTAFVPRAFPQTITGRDNSKSRILQPYTDAVQTLIRANAIPIGATLEFAPNHGSRDEVTQALANRSDRFATWEPSDVWHPLRWSMDGLAYSTSGLAMKLYELAGHPKKTVRGSACWLYQSKTLLAMADKLAVDGFH